MCGSKLKNVLVFEKKHIPRQDITAVKKEPHLKTTRWYFWN